MTKIFVTGATGLIGTKLVKRLKEEGHEVAGFTTSEHGKQKLKMQVQPMSVIFLKPTQLMQL